MDNHPSNLPPRKILVRGIAGLAVVCLGYAAWTYPSPATVGVFLGAVVTFMKLYD